MVTLDPTKVKSSVTKFILSRPTFVDRIGRDQIPTLKHLLGQHISTTLVISKQVKLVNVGAVITIPYNDVIPVSTITMKHKLLPIL